jgi:histone arginine demethylase JMJD6
MAKARQALQTSTAEMERMASAPAQVAPHSIERRNRLSYAEFANDFLKPHVPVVISGAFPGWKALQWTPEYFRQRFPDHPLTIHGQKYRMAELIDLVLNSSDERPAPYLRNEIVDRFMPELLEDIQPMPEYFSPNWLDGPMAQLLHSRFDRGRAQFFIGGKGQKFPFLHFDGWHSHAFICQIYGTKEFTLYAPDQTPYLYVKPRQYNASQIPNLEDPDYGKFPLFARAKPMRFHLEPGEMLFIPGGWWHTAKMLGPSITISVNRANASNWSSLTRDFWSTAPLPLKPVVAAYLTGMRVFRTLYGS